MQTKDAFVVHAEMIHDARIIHLDGRRHLPPDQAVAGRFDRSLKAPRWWWTTNFNDSGGFYGEAGGNFG
jgi:hypothetical protein